MRGIPFDDVLGGRGWSTGASPLVPNRTGYTVSSAGPGVENNNVKSAARLVRPSAVPDHVSFGKVHSKTTVLNAEYLELVRAQRSMRKAASTMASFPSQAQDNTEAVANATSQDDPFAESDKKPRNLSNLRVRNKAII